MAGGDSGRRWQCFGLFIGGRSLPPAFFCALSHLSLEEPAALPVFAMLFWRNAAYLFWDAIGILAWRSADRNVCPTLDSKADRPWARHWAKPRSRSYCRICLWDAVCRIAHFLPAKS